jgi:glycosyltransferase involved in cell wall biosynthesis
MGFATEQVACGSYGSGSKSWREAARFAGDAVRLAAQVRRWAAGVDVIYVNGPRVLPGATLAAAGAPILFHSHSYLPPGKERWLVGQGLRRAKAWVVGSCEFVAAPWRSFVPEDRVSVIYNGVAGPPSQRPTGGAGIQPALIGCIGRISPQKGQLEFVAAARAIHAEIPTARFAIHGARLFGEKESYENEVRRTAEGLPIHFAGWTRDIYAAIADLDILLVPSLDYEATTRVILEAFAAGVPVVAFRTGGIPEVVEHGHTGLLVDSAAEMARASIELLRAPERMAAMACAARAGWESRFTLLRFHQQLLARIEQAATAGGTVRRR